MERDGIARRVDAVDGGSVERDADIALRQQRDRHGDRWRRRILEAVLAVRAARDAVPARLRSVVHSFARRLRRAERELRTLSVRWRTAGFMGVGGGIDAAAGACADLGVIPSRLFESRGYAACRHAVDRRRLQLRVDCDRRCLDQLRRTFTLHVSPMGILPGTPRNAVTGSPVRTAVHRRRWNTAVHVQHVCGRPAGICAAGIVAVRGRPARRHADEHRELTPSSCRRRTPPGTPSRNISRSRSRTHPG